MTPLRWPHIRAVTFDAGGTLIEPWPSVGHVYATVAARHGISADVPTLNEQFFKAWKSRSRFDYSRDHWLEVVEESFLGIAQVTHQLFDQIYMQFGHAPAWRIFDDVLPVLQELSARGIKLGVISNWDERLRLLLHQLDLAAYFEVIIISAEAGAHKPDPKIFRAAAEQLRASPEEILHIGDSANEDIHGARSIGMEAVRICRDAPQPEDICDLRHLLHPQPKSP